MKNGTPVAPLVDTKWYVAYTRANFERKVAKDIVDQQIEHYLPLRRETRKWSDRLKQIEVPLFPNYIFVKIKLQHKVNILGIPGVLSLVSFSGQPVSVSEREIQHIRKIEERGQDIALEYYYCVGDRVRITQGIFTGMEGILLRKSGQMRFVLKLPAISQAVSVEIEGDQLERID
ncbi:UpxY family transcription antiterminator [Chitinophaga pinensis]|uniref:NusG antitermination factor n=1 Tax=Chitinophaga pinensis (strain ATCC 43595 / DSM 2588 / LMG 13176 / NBRC 15968 / NCIMB 11800 / UQM 2034) TaxID=485918 RepID=A0A979GS00_CHIPD|nr:UpxY family transcription antiterminator [Chitinophaga pinensis]ACU61068.1 NusG antitermination factor [Chitinophaga pinensis DSM 2588]